MAVNADEVRDLALPFAKDAVAALVMALDDSNAAVSVTAAKALLALACGDTISTWTHSYD